MKRRNPLVVSLFLVLVVVLLAWMSELANAVESQTIQKVSPPGFVELGFKELPPTAQIAWEAKQPNFLEFRQYRLENEDQKVAVFYLAPGEYVILATVVDFDAKLFRKVTWQVTVQPGPGPTPVPPIPPGPEPDEPDEPEKPKTVFGLAFLEKAQEVKFHGTPQAKKIAQNFESVASAIAAGGINSIEASRNQLRSLNVDLPRSTAPLWDWLDAFATANFTSLDQYAKAYGEIAIALRYP